MGAGNEEAVRNVKRRHARILHDTRSNARGETWRDLALAKRGVMRPRKVPL